MAIFWNDLSTSDPADTEVVSNGASRIRDVVEAGKTTTAVEHRQTGEHNFPIIQPATPLEGQIWFDLTNNFIRRFNSTDHSMVNAVGRFFAAGGATIIAAPTYVDTVALANVIVPVNGSVVLFYTVELHTTAGSDTGSPATFPSVPVHNVTRDVTNITHYQPTIINIRGDEPYKGTKTHTFFGLDVLPAAGTYTYRGRISCPTSVSVTSGSSALLALVI